MWHILKNLKKLKLQNSSDWRKCWPKKKQLRILIKKMKRRKSNNLIQLKRKTLDKNNLNIHKYPRRARPVRLVRKLMM